jgi:ATP-dependent helicase/nuclease subunit A
MSQTIAANPDHHCFVCASAGTGKTKVLVDRFVNLLKAGFHPESILCLTFTKNAALEMKERVLKIIQKEDPNLYKIVLDADLKIQTIHSFCQNVLERFEPFRILDDIDIKKLLQKAKESIYTKENQSLIYLTKKMSETQFDALLESLVANPSLFLKWKQTYGSVENYEQDLKRLLTYDAPIREDITPDLYPFCLTQKGDLRKRIDVTYREVAPFVHQHYINAIHQDMAVQTLHFLRVAELVFENYQKIKSDLKALDFHDLIQKAKTASFGDLSLSHILVDEAQDTSPNQWEIIHRLTKEYIEGKRGHTLFIVGDHKQSIYSFQGARADIFMDLPFQFSKTLDDFQTTSLSKSYRTTQDILQVVDAVFDDDLHFEKHDSARYNDKGSAVLLPLTPEVKVDYPPWGLVEDDQVFSSTKALHAQNLGRYIEEILTSDRILPSTQKTPKPQDIMVLFQKRSDLLKELERVLWEKEIPSTGVDRLILFDQLIVKDLLALAHFALLPEDDYTLACLLKSPFCNVNEHELYELCSVREQSLWEHLKHTQHRSSDFLKQLIERKNLAPFSFYAPLIQAMRFGDDQIVETFLDYVLAFEEKEVPTLRAFLEWFRTSNAYMKRREGECVRFMTVHASKGLQSPIVILADSTEKPSLRHDLFLVQDSVLLIKPAFETPWTTMVKKNMLESLRQEHDRLLYVAMTRAQDHLYITGLEKEGGWYDRLKKTSITEAVFEQEKATSPSWKSEKTPQETLFFEPYEEPQTTKEQKRGIALHALLEKMPDIPCDAQEVELLQRLLKKFPEFFEGDAEVTLATPEGIKRLDRFIEKENEVWIVEYKTHAQKPKDITSMIKQISSYKKYINQPYKKVRCFLFWVVLEEVEEID